MGAGSGDAGADQQAALSAPASAQAPSAVSRRLATSNPLSLRGNSNCSRGMFRCLGRGCVRNARYGGRNDVGACGVSPGGGLRPVGIRCAWERRTAWAVDLPAAPSANSPEAPCLVEAFLFSSRSEELSVPQLTEDSGPLHLGLEAFQKLIAVFSVTECYMCQILSSPMRVVRMVGRVEFHYTTSGAVVGKFGEVAFCGLVHQSSASKDWGYQRFLFVGEGAHGGRYGVVLDDAHDLEAGLDS